MTGSLIRPTRRGLLGTAAALGAATLPQPSLAQPSRAQSLRGTTVVFASWGGAYQEAQKICYCDPFSAETGARVVQDGPMNTARFRTMIESGTPDWDVADITINTLFSGVQENMFEKIDTSIVDTGRIAPQFVHEYGIGCIAWSYNLAFNTKTFPAGRRPTAWADLFDTRKFPGKRTMLDQPVANLEAALMADGVKPTDLYPLDVERALKKIDSIKAQTIFWTTNSQSQQLFVDEEVSVGIILNGRAYDASKKGADIGIAWEGNIQSVDYLVVPRGSRNKNAAMQLINTMTKAENQSKLANMIAYAPTNPAAFANIDPALTPWLSTSPENSSRGFVINAEWWRQNERRMMERWAAWKLA
jgi:putative spermidine/putrescine transport system substrate-binding protein